MALILAVACGPETPSTSEPTPVFDPVYQASMIDFLEQEIVKAKQDGNDALVECLTLMQEAYIRGQPMDDDEEERCQSVLGTYSSETAQPDDTVPNADSSPPGPTPNVVPGGPSSLGVILEGRLQAAIDNIPYDEKIWIDDDTVVYLLPADPHDFNGAQVAVAHHLPSKAAITYDAPGAAAYAEDVEDHPDARAAVDRMAQDPQVADAVAILLGGKR